MKPSLKETNQKASSPETKLASLHTIKEAFQALYKTNLFFLVLLLLLLAAFEFLPAIKEAQSHVSLENYQNKTASCLTFLADRPWYGKINHWFFAWIIFTPSLVFLISPKAPIWLRRTRAILAAAACYGMMNLAVHLSWDIRNAPFGEDPFGADSFIDWRPDCINYDGDGLSYVMIFYAGWIPAGIYTGLWLLLWRFYYAIPFRKSA